MIARRDLVLGALALPVAVRGAPPALRRAAPIVTRLRIAGNRIYLPVTVNGVAVEALLDSAAEATVIDVGFAARLALSAGTPVVARGSGAGTARAALVPDVVIGVAGLTLRPAGVAVLDLGDIARRLTRGPLDVVLGRELFDAARLAIDLDLGTLTVLPRTLTPPGRRLPLIARHGIESVPVTIEGHAALADFDLGNGGRMLIGADFAARHRLLDGRPTTSIGVGGIGGEAQRTALTLTTLDIAGRRLRSVAATIDANDHAADANIGVAVLRPFGIVTDFRDRAIWLDPRR